MSKESLNLLMASMLLLLVWTVCERDEIERLEKYNLELDEQIAQLKSRCFHLSSVMVWTNCLDGTAMTNLIQHIQTDGSIFQSSSQFTGGTLLKP